METLFITNVGSHMWGMQRPDSDKDLYKCYIAPSEDFLIGKNHIKGHQSLKVNGNTDISSFEIGHTIKQLKTGNVNHLWGVMSPKIIETSDEHKELIEIVKSTISKNCYNSIHGLAIHNYKKYFMNNKLDHDLQIKKLNICARTVLFGINILKNGKFEFTKTHFKRTDELVSFIETLDDVYKVSELPEKTDSEPFDDFLLKIRLERLKVRK